MATDPEDDGADPEPGTGGGRHQIQGVDHQARVKELLSSIREPMLSAMNSKPAADQGDDADDGADPEPETQENPEPKQDRRASDVRDNSADGGQEEGDRRATGGSSEGDGGSAEGDEPAGGMSAKEKADQYFKRRREKAKQQQDNQLEQTVHDLRRRIEDLTRAPTQATPKEEPKPATPAKNPFDKNDDPVAHFEWELARTNEELQTVREKNAAAEARVQSEEQAAQRAAEQKQIIDNYAKHVDSFLNPAIEEIPGFGKMIDRVVEGLAWTAIAQGAKTEDEAVRQATMTLLVIAQKAEQANPQDPDAITKAVFNYCEKVTGGVHMFQDAGQPQPGNGNGQGQPDLAGARAAAKRRAPGSINSRPGGKGGAVANTIQGLGTLRDREMTPVQAKSIFAMMRKDAGLR